MHANVVTIIITTVTAVVVVVAVAVAAAVTSPIIVAHVTTALSVFQKKQVLVSNLFKA